MEETGRDYICNSGTLETLRWCGSPLAHLVHFLMQGCLCSTAHLCIHFSCFCCMPYTCRVWLVWPLHCQHPAPPKLKMAVFQCHIWFATRKLRGTTACLMRYAMHALEGLVPAAYESVTCAATVPPVWRDTSSALHTHMCSSLIQPCEDAISTIPRTLDYSSQAA